MGDDMIQELLEKHKDYMRENCPATVWSVPSMRPSWRFWEAGRESARRSGLMRHIAIWLPSAIAQPATKRIKSSPISLPRASLPMERTTSPRKKFWLPPRQRTRRSDGISYAEQVGRRKGKAAELILGQLPDRRAIPGRFRGHV